MTQNFGVFVRLRNIRWLVMLLMAGYVLCGGIAYADSLSQSQIYSLGINYFDINADSCSTDSSTIDAGSGTDTPKWQTTIQPPYSLEDWAVEVLGDVAGRENVPTTSTITQQHVLALIAFAWGEGGNLTNDDIYNPLNTGGNYPGIDIAGAHSTSGVQSFVTFNDGVDAVARGMTGTGGAPTYQTRLGAILKDPTSTAQQFMYTLTYYQKYKGNLEWAEKSMPNYGGNPNAQSDYYNSRLSVVTDTMSNYKDRASTLIGPPGHNADKNLHSPHQLRYSFAGDTSSSTGSAAGSQGDTSSSCSTSGGVVAGSIVATAMGLAWNDVSFPSAGHEDSPSCTSADPAQNPSSCHHGFQQQGVGNPNVYTRQTYQDAWAKYNKAASTNYTDCGVFVATVLHASGVATDYPASGSGSQRQWAIDHPDKYLVIENPSISDLQPGDIMVNSDHTYIYVGKQADGYSIAEASQGNHSPEIDSIPANKNSAFTLVRVKQ